jgi:CRISPR/Cas system CSM-associated protein Csm4 (group 5 of RAMP superfamily)
MNTQYILLKCRPGARFHFGAAGLDVNTALNDTDRHIGSDTLFSALVNMADTATPDQLDDLLLAFECGDIAISSGFPCLSEYDTRVFFLPKPAHYDWSPPAHDPKLFAGIRYISAGLWERGALPKHI